jgi:hypothetical protein
MHNCRSLDPHSHGRRTTRVHTSPRRRHQTASVAPFAGPPTMPLYVSSNAAAVPS